MAIINPWIFYLIDVLSTLKQNSQFKEDKKNGKICF